MDSFVGYSAVKDHGCCYSGIGCRFRMFSSVSKNSFLYGQLLHSLNIVYLAECTTFAAIFSSLRRMVPICCLRIFADNARRLNQLNMLYASAWTWSRFAFTTLEELLTAAKSKPFLLSLIKFSMVPLLQ